MDLQSQTLSPRILILTQKLSSLLPDRRNVRNGRKKIAKEALIKGLLLHLCYNYPWRDIPYERTTRRYFNELQRRGHLFHLVQSFLHVPKRPPRSIIDATDIVSWKNAPFSQYSGKYHNYCVKLTVSVNEQGSLQDFSIDEGAKHDSKILENMLSKTKYLPYELVLDKGYESYSRRRALRKQNCQVRMEQKYYSKNRKRGPRFQFTEAHTRIRSVVERFFGSLKQFNSLRFFRFRKQASLKYALYVILLLFI